MEQMPEGLASAEDFAARHKLQTRQIGILSFLIAISCGFAFLAFGLDSPILPVVLLLCIGVPILVWNSTRVTLYIVLAAACLFELSQTRYADALTDRVPFFWNINTIVQTYAHANFKAIPFSVAEVLLIMAGVTSTVRAIAMNQVSLQSGPLIVPIGIYIGFVFMGWLNGMATGGDFKEALQEVRAQFYFMIAYLMAFNLVKERKHISHMLWITILCIGLKGILYTFRRYVTLAGAEVPDQGVGSHEEAFLFDCFMAMGLIFAMCNVRKHMNTVLWVLMPLVITGNLATNRRAATAAMIILVPILLLSAYRALAHRRKTVVAIGVSLLVGWCVYYPLFKNSESMFAQPARAVKSEFEPTARDKSSNLYRDAENANIMATIRSSPIRGYGYGKRMLHTVPIADISKIYEWWDLLPHNQVLWVWMRVGTLGFFAFWWMISSILIHLCRIVCSEEADAEVKAVSIFAMATLSMLMIFGLLDLQMSNSRDMLFTGFWIGAAARFPLLPGKEEPVASGGKKKARFA
jgi:hypothetical protein